MLTQGKRFLTFRNPHSETSGSIDLVDTRTGSSVTGWQQRMMRGLDCSTPYSRTNRKVTVKSQGNWVWRWQDRPSSLSQWTSRECYAWGLIAPGPISTLTTIPVSVDNKAKSKFIKKLGAVQKSMDGGVALGEIGKTLKQLRSPLKSLRNAIDDYFPRVIKRARRKTIIYGGRRRNSDAATRRRSVMNALTGTYLEFVFGIRPLVNDINDLTSALDRMSGRIQDMERIRGKATWGEIISDPIAYESSEWVLSGDGMSGPQQMARVRVRRSVEIKGQITYSGAVAVESTVSSLRRELGLTPRDFLPTVWNLLPWSWAVDTVFNVGNVIDAVCASYGQVRWCNQAIKTSVTETWSTAGLLSKTFSDTFNRMDLGKEIDIPSIVQIESSGYSRVPFEAGVVGFMPRFVLDAPDPRKLLNLGAAVWQANRTSQVLDGLIRSG